MKIYLTLQEFKDGRVMFRRWEKAPHWSVVLEPSGSGWRSPGGYHYEKQTMAAFLWLHKAGMPFSPEDIPEGMEYFKEEEQ